MTVRECLNKLRWDPLEDIADHELTYLHRGAPMNIKIIPCNIIVEIKSSWFTYKNSEKEEVTIPFHRVLEIRNMKTGQIVWKKRT